jgi:hypothetical protein
LVAVAQRAAQLEPQRLLARLCAQVPARPGIELQPPVLGRVDHGAQMNAAAQRIVARGGHLAIATGTVELVVHQRIDHRPALRSDLPGLARATVDPRHQRCLGCRPAESPRQAEVHLPRRGAQQAITRGQRQDVDRSEPVQARSPTRLAGQVHREELNLRATLEACFRIQQLVVGGAPAQPPGRLAVTLAYPQIGPGRVMPGFRRRRPRRLLRGQNRQMGTLGQDRHAPRLHHRFAQPLHRAKVGGMPLGQLQCLGPALQIDARLRQQVGRPAPPFGHLTSLRHGLVVQRAGPERQLRAVGRPVVAAAHQARHRHHRLHRVDRKSVV